MRLLRRFAVRRFAAAAWLAIVSWPGIAVALELSLEAGLRSGQYRQVIESANSKLQSGTETVALWSALAGALTAVGRNEEALEAYSKVVRSDASMRIDARFAQARIHYLFGDRRQGTSQFEQVLAAYRDASVELDVGEQLAAGHAARELARYQPRLFDEALAIYEKALLAAPKAIDIHVAIGDLLLDRYNAEEAVEAYRAALVIDDSFPPALLGLARAQHFDGSSAAMQSAERALEHNANFVEALALKATLQIEAEERKAAQATLQQALAINPSNPQILTLLAALDFLNDDREGFDQRVSRVRAIAPGYTAMFETLSEIAARNRRYDRAAEFALLAVTLDSSAWRAHAMLGRNRLRLGDMDSGRRSLEVAFRGDPYDPWTRNTLQLLDRLDQFEVIRSSRFELVADQREAEVLAARLLPIAEKAYDQFAETYDYRPRTPIRIEVYPRHEDFSVRTVGLVGIDIVGVSFGPVVAMDSPSAEVFGPLNIGSVLWHEIAHTFHLGLTDAKVPRWFTEGLAVFEERRGRAGWGTDATPEFLRAFARGELPPPSELNQVFLTPSSPQMLIHGYFQASLLMEVIVRDYGVEALAAVLRAFAQGFDTNGAIQAALGIEPKVLDARFDAYLRNRYGRAIEAVTPKAGAGEATSYYASLLERADKAVRDDEFDEGQRLLREALEVFPEHAGANSPYAMLGALHEKRNDAGAAIKAYEESAAINADDAQVLRRLIALYSDANRTADAIYSIERALLIHPFDIELHRQLAELYESRLAWTDAIEARAAVVSLDMSDPAQARYLLARAYHASGDLQAARRSTIDALELAPMYEEALELLLRIREQAGVT